MIIKKDNDVKRKYELIKIIDSEKDIDKKKLFEDELKHLKLKIESDTKKFLNKEENKMEEKIEKVEPKVTKTQKTKIDLTGDNPFKEKTLKYKAFQLIKKGYRDIQKVSTETGLSLISTKNLMNKYLKQIK